MRDDSSLSAVLRVGLKFVHKCKISFCVSNTISQTSVCEPHITVLRRTLYFIYFTSEERYNILRTMNVLSFRQSMRIILYVPVGDGKVINFKFVTVVDLQIPLYACARGYYLIVWSYNIII